MTDRLTPRDDLLALEGYHSPQLDVSVRLNTNESPYGPPPAFVDAWLDALRNVPLHRYPDRAAEELRAQLGAKLGQPPERIFCANGSNEVLQTLLLTFGGAGRSAALFEPTYALHAHIARITGTDVVVGGRRADFSIDVEAATALIREHRPAITFVCSPNNPTGTVETRDVIGALVDAVEVSGPGLLVVDEAYGEFAEHSALDLVADDRPIVVVRTYSKVWSLAALRLGFAVAPAWVVDELEKVVLPYHLSVPTQLAGTTALRFEAEMNARVATLQSGRDELFAALQGIAGVHPVPSGANFVLFRFEGDGHALWQRMVSRGVLVRDFSRWPGLDNCLRVTVGTPSENEAMLAALRAAIEEES
jgi:histidinol-phosphate aminotransferase